MEPNLTGKVIIRGRFKSTGIFYALGFVVLSTVLFTNIAYSATYYVSSSAGKDTYTQTEARNPSTPWKTLQKVNQCSPSFLPGDSILFKRGDSFQGSLALSRSGTSTAPIVFGAYGSGHKPQISGNTELTNWSAANNGVYQTSTSADVSNLTINGKQQELGRFPNTGYLSYESNQSNASITDNQLTDDINWTGAEVVIRKNRWVIDKSKISAHAGSTLSYLAGNKAYPTKGYGYFIQKDVRTLDRLGEWYYDPAAKRVYVYFGTRKPESFHTTASVVKHLVSLKNLSFISFENISFTGAAGNAFNIVQGKNITVKECDILNTGEDAVWASYTPALKIINCKIENALSGGLNLDAGCVNALVSGNLIRNIGKFAGLGKSGTGTYEGITSFGDNAVIEKNRIDSIGYNGIYFGGSNSAVRNNVITYFCLTKDDGAGIYLGDWMPTVNKEVTSNIVAYGIGNGQGTSNSNSLQAEGIYLDDNTQSVNVSGNTVSNCNNNGIKVHNAKDIVISRNTVYNNTVQLRLEQDHYIETSSLIRNNNISNNIFLSKNSLQAIVKVSSHQDDITAFGRIEKNVYNHPKSNGAAFKSSVVRNGRTVNHAHDFPQWRKAFGQDNVSIEVPTELALFEYNMGSTIKTIQLKHVYVDAYNNTHAGQVKLSPYKSIVLFDRPANVPSGKKAAIATARL